ncbi:unnamed protein product [Nesidiocoris tenuis]|uniref:Uncharacterized protein n=1 Tax=Nesidiocoris tenuis TaxID=355587 RepID=A0A6H5HDC3_9HEMI|nr:unnamed protein product [Nesidiocoris tenuis]
MEKINIATFGHKFGHKFGPKEDFNQLTLSTSADDERLLQRKELTEYSRADSRTGLNPTCNIVQKHRGVNIDVKIIDILKNIDA